MSVSRTWAWIQMLCWVAVLSIAADNPFENMVVSGFRVPEYDEEGQMVSQFFGENAVYESDGQVKITGVRVEFYRDEETFQTVESPYCFYDQDTRDARSDAAISAKMDGFDLSGVGFELGLESRLVEVKSQSRVEIVGAMKNIMGAVSEETDATDSAADEDDEVTVITSTQLFLNYTNRTALFVDSVHVQHPSMELDSGSLELRFSEEENEIDTLEALEGSRLLIVAGIQEMGASEVSGTDSSIVEIGLDPEVVEMTNTPTVITSQEMFLDYTAGTARFMEDVHVEDDQLILDSEILNLRFGENNEISWIEALVKVRLLSEGREAYAGRLVFETEEGAFLLEESPRLVQGRNMLIGDRIRFWRSTKRMVCEPSARVVFYPDDEIRGNFLE